MMDPPSFVTAPASTGGISAARLRRARTRRHLRGVLAVTAWTVLFLIAADVSLNILFRRPANPRVDLTGMRGYLSYGYSTEGKLHYMVRATDATSGKLVPAGWVEGVAGHPGILAAPAGTQPRLRLSVFGMSFSNDITRNLHQMDSTVQVAQYAGPAAPPNHSFAVYRASRALGPAAPKADFVIWGILASSVKGMTTMTGLTWMFEAPAPFCYPRYTFDPAGNLLETWPTVHNVQELRQAVANPRQMARFRASLAAGDRFYQSLTFGNTWADRSAIARMLRRALADHHISTLSAKIDRKDGFAEDDPDIGPPLRAMCRDFAATARADGRRPIILLIQDQGSTDHLYRLLAPALDAAGIPYLSTHELVKTTDRSNFVSDGHFTNAAYDRVAAALLQMINHASQ